MPQNMINSSLIYEPVVKHIVCDICHVIYHMLMLHFLISLVIIFTICGLRCVDKGLGLAD